MNEHTPSELEGIESRLDQLGRSERGAVPDGLADRIALATADELGSSPVVARLGFGRAAAIGGAIAAAAAVLIAVPLVIFGGGLPSSRIAGGPDEAGGGVDIGAGPIVGLALAEPDLEQDLETFAFVAAMYEDDWTQTWSDDLDAVSDRARDLDSALDDPWESLSEWLEPSASDT
ncbi:MAG: hypothetical protein AAF297_06300 [Planctomycetota bacterium]